MQGLGASAAAGLGLASTRGPVGEAEAIPPIVIGGAAAGASAAFGWALREFEVIGSDSPPEGLTAEALKQGVYETARTRKSTNGSTFVDNKNILDGLQHTAYVDGKIEAIEALNDQQSQSDVQDAAIDAVNDYATTVKGNFLKGWNESVREIENLADALEDHPEAEAEDVLQTARVGFDGADPNTGSDTEVDLPDGSTLQLKRMRINVSDHDIWDPITYDRDDGEDAWVFTFRNGNEYEYLRYSEWNDVYLEIENTFDDVRDGIITWVDNVYSDVQSGEIDVTELITPRERAAMMAEEEGMAQAIADLQALNIPIDVEREATIYLPHVDATIRGTLGITQDQSIESGETYDPDEDIDGSAYLTYDVSLGEGTWGGYEDGIDGGEVTFTDEPWPGTTFRIHTTAGESVERDADDFTPVDDDGDEVEDWEDPDRWLVDISDDVEDAITEIDEVEYFPSDDTSEFKTIQLQEEFTVERIEDTSSGEEADSMEFESSEPQTDDNYITQEEWDEMEQQNQDLIEKYEDSQSSGGLGDFFDGPELGGVPAALIVIIAAAAAAFGLTN